MDNIIKKIASSKILLDVLIAFEDFLDRNDLYAYRNWDMGEVIAGPEISRYWVKITLKYAYKNMPDPTGAERLVRNGLRVTYRKEQEEHYFDDVSMTDRMNVTGMGFSAMNEIENTEEPEMIPVWLIDVVMPRRFIESVIEDDIVNFDGEIDLEDLMSARTANIDSKNSFMNNNPADTADSGDDEELDL